MAVAPKTLAEIFAQPAHPFTTADYHAYGGVEGNHPMLGEFPNGVEFIIDATAEVVRVDLFVYNTPESCEGHCWCWELKIPTPAEIDL